MAYSAKVMDHFANPRNVGEMQDYSGVGEVGNPKCGDIMRMYIKVENNVITDVSFMTFGCGAAIATSSMATEMIKGKTLDDALKLTNKAVMEALDGLPPVKVHCSVLAEQAIKAAVADYYKRQGIDPPPSWASSLSATPATFKSPRKSHPEKAAAFSGCFSFSLFGEEIFS